MPSMVRNPLRAIVVTLFEAASFAPLLCLPVILFALGGFPVEVSLVWGVAAFAVAGMLAGRSGTFAVGAFATAFLGALVGYGAFFALAFPPVDMGFAAVHALIAAVGAWATATRVMAKVTADLKLENEDKLRCKMCGERVGPRARRCWSCRASLARYT